MSCILKILIFSKTYRCGPFFYLSKLESSNEAKLWAQIFDWSENELGLSHGTIKACVLIENILASFDMENILYEVPIVLSLKTKTILFPLLSKLVCQKNEILKAKYIKDLQKFESERIFARYSHFNPTQPVPSDYMILLLPDI